MEFGGRRREGRRELEVEGKEEEKEGGREEEENLECTRTTYCMNNIVQS